MNLKKLLATGHKFPLTRRELIGHGLMTAAGVVLGPTLFPRAAFAAQCDEPPSNWMPFLVFDCAGGAGLAGNFVVTGKGGAEDYLPDYSRMGVPKSPAKGGPVDKQFGAGFHQDLSKIREGILTTASPAALAKLRMGLVCNISQDDSNENMLSPLPLVSDLGLRGKHIAAGLGDRPTDSGGQSKSPVFLPQWKPVAVKGADDIAQALSYGKHLSGLSIAQRERLAKSLKSLSASQLNRFRSLPHGEEMAAVATCGYLKSERLATPVEGMDPRQDAVCAQIYGLKPDTKSEEAKAAAIAYNVIKGNTGPGALTIEGCDYHDGTQATGDAKDLEIGQNIGRAVELAYKMGKPLYFAVISDGATYSDPGTRIWRGDAGTHGLAIAGFFHPTRVPEMRKLQLGHFTSGQAVDRSTYVGAEPKRAAYALFLNYLAAHGEAGQFSRYVNETEFSSSEIDAHLLFA